MRLIIEARLEGAQTGATVAEATIVDVVERQDRSVADLGLTLAEGRALLAKVQSILLLQQTAGWMASQVACCRCGSVLAHKDSRSIVLRTVFGKVEVPQGPQSRARPGGAEIALDEEIGTRAARQHRCRTRNIYRSHSPPVRIRA
jgi:hypothetical protein